ncbi:RadC family protein [Enterococcus gallinarum]|uniref:RadC family protein n=1 Tax=Enterococcus gallinarum TaxID=1353 RepID=UPI001073F552|nr:DNA repair protein RadC [Enterococcus gallinarum]MBF0825578.1 DNA repair protein RadC [Enterococcus faecalis]MBX8991784.1 DNA repair protein RadC [Escherichia coli]MBF0726237.1 DNA repair protein RadC [Enterococcus gallinarum]MBF0799120.1 DNA repair protein RadC [Enterococcus gallinarum]NYS82338.1 DNA repair protein RadC [Enterococcus gallinarum]
MEKVYEIVKVKQEINVKENFAPLKLTSSYSIASWLQVEIGMDTQENLVLLCLDTKNNVTCYSIVHRGTINQSIVHPRDIFQRAILSNATRILLAHNHPSGNPTPSEADNIVTKRIEQAGELMGIPLLDHIIVGYDEYFSYKENSML